MPRWEKKTLVPRAGAKTAAVNKRAVKKEAKKEKPKGGVLRKPDDGRDKTPTGDSWLSTVLDQIHRGEERNRMNTEQAYEDLRFLAGDQWPAHAKLQRERQKRPILTVNRLPQFVHQVTGDIRMSKPAIKVVSIDNKAKPEIAEVLSGMIRYVENRSEAKYAYDKGADSQVAAGIGHWRIAHEYADETTLNQELRIRTIDDGVGVIWDPDASLPTREDAMWCLVPVDMTQWQFKKKYPDKSMADINSIDKRFRSFWYGTDVIRVGEFWEKREIKRTVAAFEDGTVKDLTEAGEEEVKKAKAQGARVEQRPGYEIWRSLITAGGVLEEPTKWPGRLIPIIPALGEEVRIGREIVRHGIVRHAKDSQRMYNFSRSAQTEVFALQPKSPFVGTKKNFQEDEAKWETANQENWPYLEYTPDPLNGGAAPQRQPPPVASQALSEAVRLADNDMKAVTGIYDASLGARSNETSGVAIRARQQEGDVGTIVYIENFAMAIRHTGRVLIDLIPHIYDTERMIHVLGEDGKMDLVWINKSTGVPKLAPEEALGGIPLFDEAGETEADETREHGDLNRFEGLKENDPTGTQPGKGQDRDDDDNVLNDVTIGAYAVTIEQGPSYSTKRAEARAGMIQLLQSAPNVAPLILDLVARAQDWPMADHIAERIETTLPPEIRQQIEKNKTAPGEMQEGGPMPPEMQPQQPPQPQGPPPEMRQAAMQADMAKIEADVQEQQAKAKQAMAAAEKAAADARAAQASAQLKELELAQAQGNTSHADALVQIMEELHRQRGMIEEVVAQMHGEIGNPPDRPSQEAPNDRGTSDAKPPSGGFFIEG